MPSELALLDERKTDIDYVGRWGAGSSGGSADYTRTFRQVVIGMQKRLVQAFREGAGFDKLAEADITDAMREFLRTRRAVEGQAADCFINEWDKLTWEFIQGLGKTVTVLETDTAATLPQPDEPTLQPVFPTPSPQEIAQVQASSRSKVNVARSSKFLIVFTRNRKQAKLHKALGGCHWSQVELLDCKLCEMMPEPASYNSRCVFCWPELRKSNTVEGEPVLASVDKEGSEAESDSSEDAVDLT